MSAELQKILLVLAAVAGLASAQSPAASGRTVSNSGQFIVHGSNLAVRSGVASLAETTRQALVKEVGEGPVDEETGRARWEHTIVIELHEAGSSAMKADFLILDNGFRLQLDVHLSRGIDREALERKLLELLIYERGLRGRDPGDVPERLFVSPWLVDGLREAIRWRAQTADRDLYQVLFERNAVMPVGELLDLARIDELDGASRASYRVSAGALVMGLLAQEDGRTAMGEMLAAAATYAGDAPGLLRQFFPGMNLGAKSLQKWWALQLARMAEPSILSTLTIAQTEARLSEILVLRVQLGDDADGVMEIRPEHYRDLLAVPEEARKLAMEKLVGDANTFYLRAFPAYRPIIEEYLRILSELAREIDDRVDQRLRQLAVERAMLQGSGEKLGDLLNWYQITSAREVSGAFRDYHELKRRLEAEEARRRGGGPVSRYLDQMEALFEEAGNGL